MDDYTIHINVRLEKSGDQHIAYTKERIWRPLVSFLTWITNGVPMNGFVRDGVGLTFITNMGIIVEGIIADIIDEYRINNKLPNDPKDDLEKATWVAKMRIYNSLFDKKISNYSGYKAVKILFIFRNNVAHGLSHVERSAIQQSTNHKSKLSSTNKEYEKIRTYFIRQGVMKNADTPGNVNQLWNYTNIQFLWHEIRKFIEEVLQHNESKHNKPILSEWETAILGRG